MLYGQRLAERVPSNAAEKAALSWSAASANCSVEKHGGSSFGKYPRASSDNRVAIGCPTSSVTDYSSPEEDRRKHTESFPSVVLLDISVRLVKQDLIAMELTLERCSAKRLLNFPFAGGCILPAWESNCADNFRLCLSQCALCASSAHLRQVGVIREAMVCCPVHPVVAPDCTRTAGRSSPVFAPPCA